MIMLVESVTLTAPKSANATYARHKDIKGYENTTINLYKLQP